MPEMRAALFDRYGPPEVLRIGTVPRPEPEPGQVLVRVQATSLNGGEVQGRSGRLRLVLGNRFPQRLGIDLVGEVAGIGTGVTDLNQGDPVWGVSENPIGTNAEYFALSRDRVSRPPANLSPIEAVTLIAGGTTAITALRDRAHLRAGERLLVRGAAGGVGSLGVQVGKLYGAHVTALARTESFDYVRGLGADDVLDYRTTDLNALAGFDVILDTAGSRLLTVRRLLNRGGRMVTITIDMNHRLASLTAVIASTIHRNSRVQIFRGSPNSALLTELAQLTEQGRLRPIVDQVFPLDQIMDAHRALEAGGVQGKHVIQIRNPP